MCTKQVELSDVMEIQVVDEDGNIHKTYRVLSNNAPRTLEAYDTEAGEFEHLQWRFLPFGDLSTAARAEE